MAGIPRPVLIILVALRSTAPGSRDNNELVTGSRSRKIVTGFANMSKFGSCMVAGFRRERME